MEQANFICWSKLQVSLHLSGCSNDHGMLPDRSSYRRRIPPDIACHGGQTSWDISFIASSIHVIDKFTPPRAICRRVGEDPAAFRGAAAVALTIRSMTCSYGRSTNSWSLAFHAIALRLKLAPGNHNGKYFTIDQDASTYGPCSEG